MGIVRLREKPVTVYEQSVDQIMEDNAIYRERLIKHCLLHFDYDRDTAEDCVQEAYLVLYDSLARGVEISNIRAWLYQVTINYGKKAIRDKLKRNEYDFADNEEKDSIMENALSYEPDFVDNMISDETIEERALKIIASLDDSDKALFISRYRDKKSFVEIASNQDISPELARKRHELLRKNILKKIKDYEKA